MSYSCDQFEGAWYKKKFFVDTTIMPYQPIMHGIGRYPRKKNFRKFQEKMNLFSAQTSYTSTQTFMSIKKQINWHKWEIVICDYTVF